MLVVRRKSIDTIAFDIDGTNNRVTRPNGDDGFSECRAEGRQIPRISSNIIDDDRPSLSDSRAVQALCPRKSRKHGRSHARPCDNANLRWRDIVQPDPMKVAGKPNVLSSLFGATRAVVVSAG